MQWLALLPAPVSSAVRSTYISAVRPLSAEAWGLHCQDTGARLFSSSMAQPRPAAKPGSEPDLLVRDCLSFAFFNLLFYWVEEWPVPPPSSHTEQSNQDRRVHALGRPLIPYHAWRLVINSHHARTFPAVILESPSLNSAAYATVVEWIYGTFPGNGRIHHPPGAGGIAVRPCPFHLDGYICLVGHCCLGGVGVNWMVKLLAHGLVAGNGVRAWEAAFGAWSAAGAAVETVDLIGQHRWR